MPRTSQKVACRYCLTNIDTRGIRVHELTCKQRPADEVSNIRQIDQSLLHSNLRVLVDAYKAGLDMGVQLAGERKAA